MKRWFLHSETVNKQALADAYNIPVDKLGVVYSKKIKSLEKRINTKLKKTPFQLKVTKDFLYIQFNNDLYGIRAGLSKEEKYLILSIIYDILSIFVMPNCYIVLKEYFK